MTDHADIVREALLDVEYPSPQHPEALAALDALVAERDEARRDWKMYQHEIADETARAEAAEAEVVSLTQSVLVIQNYRAKEQAEVVLQKQSIKTIVKESGTVVSGQAVEIRRLTEALEWYADIPVGQIPYEEDINEDPDIGKIARAALGEDEG